MLNLVTNNFDGDYVKNILCPGILCTFGLFIFLDQFLPRSLNNFALEQTTLFSFAFIVTSIIIGQLNAIISVLISHSLYAFLQIIFFQREKLSNLRQTSSWHDMHYIIIYWKLLLRCSLFTC
ncbi:hypothetical protein A2291_01875 [candidate division WOR-1 bacterium RIFOXYB2_FULL_42_35]|uniref:Uncharacterized protein n=1 Tax=candidate division WOR-1 bacterium RIFOXYC2_FULL_41_25 TaxID=1802586 RepID=A0A1F4TPZ3_UNCSA|nr:MAG: hypothetical protein A2247_03675 [candidate division WOR-1 bacterium RIFOXYA2_FULL_41_14]OGC25151.1 MAG: hypothetical protein A2291_01875 [candidate division WOR-1 bacterium RIFOXYB2_FULL_42_35]OGC34707.1 MAG: hypothetical protein A2462_03190 [candidate division WOR-1 bacterium RIFOXYC2_FULL_41_25]OGC41931.1 MAG: hypothetical protein A2548_04905 [candidate division WOR-1 bacterium RIFOXYD2_FULL_41_8]